MWVVASREFGSFGTSISRPVSVEWRRREPLLSARAWWTLGLVFLVGLSLVVAGFYYVMRASALADGFDPLPSPSGPTNRPVTADDLLGRWQFYVDSASRTVTLDFLPDGTFTQTIVANRGGTQECPGGTWGLDGASVHLTGYVTAGDGSPHPRTWQIVDTPFGPALYGGDGPDAKTFFCIRRQPT